jgi:hypothetical protein
VGYRLWVQVGELRYSVGPMLVRVGYKVVAKRGFGPSEVVACSKGLS